MRTLLLYFNSQTALIYFYISDSLRNKKMSDLKTPQDNRLGDDAAYADGGAEPKNVQVGRYT